MPLFEQLSPNITDSLNAANAPSTTNPVATLNDLNASEVLFTADIVDARTGAGAMLPVYTINYPVNPYVVNGRSRKLRYILNYSKVSGAASADFQIVAGGITLTFPTDTLGSGVRTNDTYVIEVFMNFRTGNQAHLAATLYRSDGQGALLESSLIKTTALGTWNKTIANTISLNWQVLTGTNGHTLTLQQVTSELI